jgi:alkylation response protein AidB-like acyl-CoA dehydrogenase
MPDDAEGVLVAEARAVAAFKKVVLLIAGSAMQKFGEKLQDEQEVLTYIADIVIDTYAADSAVLRAQAAAGGNTAALQADAASVYVSEAAGRIELAARSCLAAMSDGDVLRTQLAALRRLLKVTPVNAVMMRRRLADATVSKGGYPLYMA